VGIRTEQAQSFFEAVLLEASTPPGRALYTLDEILTLVFRLCFLFPAGTAAGMERLLLFVGNTLFGKLETYRQRAPSEETEIKTALPTLQR
jgi:hypothetical protein